MGDPMSAAGLAFAVLGFPQQMFTTGVVAYTTISDFRHMGQVLSKHHINFKIQESRYIFWGTCHHACNPDGLDFTRIPTIVQEAVVNALIQINTLLEDRAALCSKYGLQVEPGQINQPNENVIRRESMRQQNMVKRLQKGSTFFRKAKWVIRDQIRFADLVRQLRDQIDILYDMLPIPLGSYVDDTIAADAIAEMVVNGPVQSTNEPFSILEESTDVPLVAEMQKATVSSAGRELAENAVMDVQRTIVIPPFDVQALEFFDVRSTSDQASNLRARARSRHRNSFGSQDNLVVEWRRYDPQRGREAYKAALFARIQALVAMLKEKPRSGSFRVLDCLGYFEDNRDTRYGLTFQFPRTYTYGRDPEPRSLHEVISSSVDQIPFLGDRFHLAYLLAETVHALHTTNWLHKCICSHNILLFPKASPTGSGSHERPIILDNPYFTGFALSRPDDPAESLSLSLNTSSARELEIYQHPYVSEKQKFRAIFDIYSLGMVLIELGTWEIISKYYPRNPPPRFNFTNFLLDKVVPGLGVSMGEKYMKVVQKCLVGDFERLSGFAIDEYNTPNYKQNVRQGLLWEVVSVLRECRA